MKRRSAPESLSPDESIEELRAAYAQDPPVPDEEMSSEELEDLCDFDNLTFTVMFQNEEPHLQIQHTDRRTLAILAGTKAKEVLDRLSPETRKKIVLDAARDKGRFIMINEHGVNRSINERNHAIERLLHWTT